MIHTPFRAAWKDYIGNAALRRPGRGGLRPADHQGRQPRRARLLRGPPRPREQGVPARASAARTTALKGGLNGIDNGRLHFTQRPRSRAPTCSTATATSTPTAPTRSPIASPGRRFFTMLGTLVQGRVSLDGAAVAASKLALKIAIHLRAPSAASSTPPRRPTRKCCWTTSGTSAGCFTRLATTYAASFAHERAAAEVRRRLLRPARHRRGPPGPRDPRRGAQAAEHLARAGHAAGMPRGLRRRRLPDREPLRLAPRRPRRLRHLRGRQQRAAAAGRQAPAHRLRQGIPQGQRRRAGPLRRVPGHRRRASTAPACASVAQFVADSGSVQKAAIAIKDEASQRALLTDRVQTMVARGRPRPCKGANKLPQQQGAAAVQRAPARAHRGRPGPRASCCSGRPSPRPSARSRTPARSKVLTWLRDLFGLSLIEKNLSWYLMNGRLSMQRGRTVGELHQPPAREDPPARPGPRRRLRLRPGAPPRRDRHRRREGPPGRGPGLLPRSSAPAAMPRWTRRSCWPARATAQRPTAPRPGARPALTRPEDDDGAAPSAGAAPSSSVCLRGAAGQESLGSTER